MKTNLRSDISTTLIHFTKGLDDEASYQNLLKILSRRIIIANFNRDTNRNVVCLTETPFQCIQENNGLKSCTGYSFTSCFGILFTKKHLYEQFGSRPVIEIEREYLDKLHYGLVWRAQIFEPKFVPPYLDKEQHDYSWQREWRTNIDILLFPDTYHVIVPSEEWLIRLKKDLEVIGKQIYDDCLNEAIQEIEIEEYEQKCNDCPDPELFVKQNYLCITGDC